MKGLRAVAAGVAALPPELQWRCSVLVLRRIEADCKARTLVQTGDVTFSRSLAAEFPDATSLLLGTANHWSLAADILNAVCPGQEPSQSFASRAVAIAHHRSLNPLRR